jgi:hypothetical protein
MKIINSIIIPILGMAAQVGIIGGFALNLNSCKNFPIKSDKPIPYHQNDFPNIIDGVESIRIAEFGNDTGPFTMDYLAKLVDKEIAEQESKFMVKR